jgi:hypothetical protein
MTNGRSLVEREQQLLESFARRRPLALTPQQLLEKWLGITRNQVHGAAVRASCRHQRPEISQAHRKMVLPGY